MPRLMTATLPPSSSASTSVQRFCASVVVPRPSVMLFPRQAMQRVEAGASTSRAAMLYQCSNVSTGVNAAAGRASPAIK